MTDNASPPARRILYRDAALADGRSDSLQLGLSVLVTGDQIAWIRPADAEEDPGPADGLDPLSDPSALWRVWRVAWAPDPDVVHEGR